MAHFLYNRADIIKPRREVYIIDGRKNIFITANYLDDNMQVITLKSGDILTMKKELENSYDDEAIAVYDEHK